MIKLLIDSCLSKNAVHVLQDAGYDTVWVPGKGKDPGDQVIMRWALEENRILITMDKDFGELVFVFNEPHPPIIRIVDFKPADQGKVIVSVLKQYNDLLTREKPIITIESEKIRIRTKD